MGAMATLLAPGLNAQAARPVEIAADLPESRLQGQGRLRFLGLHVYDARLWSVTPVDAANYATLPLALELEYARTLYGRLIAERSIDEIRQLGEPSPPQLERWRAALETLLPDVQAGDRITGVQRPGEATRFHHNGRWVGELRDGDFTRLFFGIWLSPRSSEPRLRDALLGRR
jgi:hypothetical protein